MKLHDRIIGALKKYGLKRTVQISFITIIDNFFDYRYGTDTVQTIELEDLEINSQNKAGGKFYAHRQGKNVIISI
jgi:hypothetical protein